MTMQRAEFESLNTIQMSLQSAEQHLHHNVGSTQLQLSCALINIARGTCVIVIRPDGEAGKSPFGNVLIPADRPVMQAQISLAPSTFKELITVLQHPAPRPVTLVMSVVETLSVSRDGSLFIERSLDTAVTDIYWILPVK